MINFTNYRLSALETFSKIRKKSLKLGKNVICLLDHVLIDEIFLDFFKINFLNLENSG